MKPITDLLKQKNHYLIQIKKLSTTEYNRLRSGDRSHIKSFYLSRQTLLEAISHIDHLLKKRKAPVNKKDKKIVETLLKETRVITKNILKKDLLIHSYLNNAHYDILEDKIA